MGSLHKFATDVIPLAAPINLTASQKLYDNSGLKNLYKLVCPTWWRLTQAGLQMRALAAPTPKSYPESNSERLYCYSGVRYNGCMGRYQTIQVRVGREKLLHKGHRAPDANRGHS